MKYSNTFLAEAKPTLVNRLGFAERARQDWKRHWEIYLIALPVLLYYFMFCYVPMYGAVIAFKQYSPGLGILRSPWVGLENFRDFFSSYYFWRILKNTVVISFSNLLFGFPAPIILALLLNEVKVKWFKRSVQTISYLPHFISLVVVCGLIKTFLGGNGIINQLLFSFFGIEKTNLLNNASAFVPIYVLSGIWQEIGWGSIIYLAALSGIDPSYYEAAVIDGASRWQKMWNITIPCILPTIIIMLILKIGGLMNLGHEKIILLYNDLTYDTADTISTFVYRKGLQEYDWSYSTAVGLFNSIINFILLISSNYVSRKCNDTSIW